MLAETRSRSRPGFRISHGKFGECSEGKVVFKNGLIVIVYETDPTLDVLTWLWWSNTSTLSAQVTSVQKAHTLDEVLGSNAECKPADESTKLAMDLLVARFRFEIGSL